MNNVLENVSVTLKANVYFDGKVVSHSLLLKDSSKKSVGLIYPGTYNFATKTPELMEITAGSCRVKLAGQNDWKKYDSGGSFQVPANSAFDITVENGIVEYLCSYL